jgi:hypothetical protein
MREIKEADLTPFMSANRLSFGIVTGILKREKGVATRHDFIGKIHDVFVFKGELRVTFAWSIETQRDPQGIERPASAEKNYETMGFPDAMLDNGSTEEEGCIHVIGKDDSRIELSATGRGMIRALSIQSKAGKL